MDLLPNTDPNSMYINKKIYLVVVGLVIVGGLNWLLVGSVGVDAVKLLLGRKAARFVYIVVGIAALLLSFRRDVYLPFLGQAHIPGGALSLKTPQGANETVTITTRPGAKVLYWSTEPNPNTTSAELPTWDQAYKSYENSGVVQADDRGLALLRIRGPPQAYRVPMKGRLEPHVHFRVEEGPGMLGRVQTKSLKTGTIEGFAASI